jgi:subtilisin family serine protease
MRDHPRRPHRAPTPGWTAIVALLAFAGNGLAAPTLVKDKIKITKEDDLPRHTYEVSVTVAELVKSWDALAPLAKQVRANLEADLETYDIQDKTTHQSIHGTLLTLDMLDGNYDSALQQLGTLRELEDKPALKLTSGIGVESRVAAIRETGGPEKNLEAYRKAFGRVYEAKVSALPYEVVQDVLQSNKAQMEIFSEPLLMGVIQERLEPMVAEAGSVSGPVAGQILGIYNALQWTLPVKDVVVAVLQDVIDANRVEKPNIWPARSLDLSDAEGLTPVLVAVWDTGVDPSVYGKRMYTNANEKRNGKDDDGNGFVDDVHGIAYDLHWHPTTGELYPMDDASRPIPELQDQSKGLFDMQAALDTPESMVLRQKLSELAQEDVKTFLEDLGHYTMYSHGTHVAGIAVDGNPAASVLISRLTGDARMVPEPPTMEDCQRSAEAFAKTVDYFKQAGVRVVNMSWVVARSSLENDLEQNNVGKDAEERKAMAREMFEVMKKALHEAIEGAPDILFVGGAGNSDNDIQFDEFFPPMFQLPNLMIAGAVDQAGEATSFTSFGPTVNVYSNGFEVESYVPGGDRVKFSGTSMASPNVANLAAKLIALDSDLSPPDVIELILKGADEVSEGDNVMRVIHPKRSAELATSSDKRASM